MKFEQIFPLLLETPDDIAFHQFELYVHRRNQDINTFNEITKKKIARATGKNKNDAIVLTEEEKALIKALGLKPKDLAALRGIAPKSSKEIQEEQEALFGDSDEDGDDVKELIDND